MIASASEITIAIWIACTLMRQRHELCTLYLCRWNIPWSPTADLACPGARNRGSPCFRSIPVRRRSVIDACTVPPPAFNSTRRGHRQSADIDNRRGYGRRICDREANHASRRCRSQRNRLLFHPPRECSVWQSPVMKRMYPTESQKHASRHSSMNIKCRFESHEVHIGGKICGNFARSLARRTGLTSTTVGNVPLSFISYGMQASIRIRLLKLPGR